AGFFFEHRGPGDVRGHQVGRELDTFERDIENLADGRDHEGLGQAGHPDEQTMTAGEDGGKDLLDDVALPDDDPATLVHHGLALLVELRQVLTGGGHGVLAPGWEGCSRAILANRLPASKRAHRVSGGWGATTTHPRRGGLAGRQSAKRWALSLRSALAVET